MQLYTKGLLIQAVGRAGRVGKSAFSNVFITNEELECLFGEEMDE